MLSGGESLVVIFGGLFVGVLILFAVAIKADFAAHDSYKAACYSAGGDFVQREGKYSSERWSCWKTATGTRLFPET